MTIRVLIADGQWLIRAGLKATLERPESGVRVVAEAGDLTALKAALSRELPDVLLLDAALPGGGGLDAARIVLQNWPDVKVLVMADPSPDLGPRAALQAGCHGLVAKQASVVELLDALGWVARGGIHLDPKQVRQLVLEQEAPPPDAVPDPLGRLSEREKAVFKLIAEGLTNRAAGEHLQLSPKTVEKYRAAVMVKLRLHSAVDLRLLAMELGVVQRPETAARLAR